MDDLSMVADWLCRLGFAFDWSTHEIPPACLREPYIAACLKAGWGDNREDVIYVIDTDQVWSLPHEGESEHASSTNDDPCACDDCKRAAH